MNNPYGTILPTICAMVMALLCACSNTKNTASTRAFHNVTSRYNVVFEARESFEAGLLAIENGVKLDYSDILPVHKYDYPGAAQIASGYMDACVEECGKNILKHSIVAKPARRYSRSGMSDNDMAFYNKPEYCKWIDDTYLLMGKANYITGDFFRAESSLELCVTRFRNEPSKFEAMLWLAKAYWANNKLNEAHDLLDKLSRDLRHPKSIDEDIQKAYAQIAISRRQYPLAINHLENARALARKKDDRAWITYLLGDLNRMAGRYPEARECYEQVVKLRPQYSMVFNAKINLAVVFTPGDDVGRIRESLMELAKDPNNQTYRDQIYYALAQLDYRNGNINQALANYRLSAQYSTNNNVQKANSYLASADIYFSKNDYINAGIFYDSTMSYLPKTYSGYKEISEKAANLTSLITQIRAAEHQDSLQRVARMSESERKKLIQQIIVDVVNREEAEKLRQQQPYYPGRDNSYGVDYTGTDGNPNFSGKWYLYNVTALNYGRSEFLKKWGTRPLEDNWRRKNKSVSQVSADDDTDDNQAAKDSTANLKDPEYYLRNLPLTDSAMNASILQEAEAWFAVSCIYEERIGDIDRAIETLLHINGEHPGHPLLAQSLYQLVKLYKLKGENQLAEYNRLQLASQFPESGYSHMLSDPNYRKNLEDRKLRALDIYNNAVQAFTDKQYMACLEICRQGQKEFADLPIAVNFIYMEARSCGNLGYLDVMRSRLEHIVEKYPKSDLLEPAQRKLEALRNTVVED